MVQSAQEFICRYGTVGIFLRFPEMSEGEGEALIEAATRHGG
jgi:hypothetical protein